VFEFRVRNAEIGCKYFVDVRPKAASGLHSRRDEMSAPAHVLIVEDDVNALSGYLEFLSVAGFEPTGISDGAEALRIALNNPFDAIVTDIALPGMTGFNLAAALRSNDRTRHVPIIGLTAHWAPELHATAASVAMHAVLLKPCVPAHLVAELERLLAHTKTSTT
jgi:CheY-like chemotaxis protein